MERIALVVTTVQQPNDVMRALAEGAAENNWHFVVVGDKKGPSAFDLPSVDFWDFEMQGGLNLTYAKKVPSNHYCRKNIGYLIAISNGATIIVETDDDNFPRKGFFERRRYQWSVESSSEKGWINVYRYFHQGSIWPRGFPLMHIHSTPPALEVFVDVIAPIQQGLADGNPDVDAIYRLVGDLPAFFVPRNNAVALSTGQYCPFNSQNTTTFSVAFPLLYLPAYCSFRMTDIWRSFVALRICHAVGWRAIFHNATVYQERNKHDLMNDFKEELDGYLKNESIVRRLEDLDLNCGPEYVNENLRRCYSALVEAGYFIRDELELVDAWLGDLEKIMHRGTAFE